MWAIGSHSNFLPSITDVTTFITSYLNEKYENIMILLIKRNIDIK